MCRLNFFLKNRIIISFSFLAIFCVYLFPVSAQTQGNLLVLKIDPSAEYPRNSEGSFVTLKSGTILFAYTQFYGGSR